MRPLILFAFWFITIKIFAQADIDTVIDQRDGRIYETVTIGHLKWFRDNLQLETPTSHCPNFARRQKDCINGNFYTYQELDKVCPEGWRIPNEHEWQTYFDYRLHEQSGHPEDVKRDTFTGEFLAITFKDTKENVALFGDPNPLKLKEFGWVEGNRVKNKGTTTIWVRHSSIHDDRFHLHIGDDKYIVHNHKHHIDDVPKKTRKFMVKCVTDATNQ